MMSLMANKYGVCVSEWSLEVNVIPLDNMPGKHDSGRMEEKRYRKERE